MRRDPRLRLLSVAPLLVLVLAALPAQANWVATGTFRYEDREQDLNGFTGVISEKPIRFADVEVFSNKKVIAKGKTDAAGAFSVAVVDSTVRSVQVRALTRTESTNDLLVRVVSGKSTVYAVTSQKVANHDPSVNVNFGTMVAEAGSGGEAFNILDQGIWGADYVKALTGSRPNKLVTFRWAVAAGVTVSYTDWGTCYLRDTGGYDDGPILHEWAHYVMSYYSRTSSAGGTHYLSDCDQDLWLAFDEGRATSFGLAVRRHFGMPASNVYVRTDGASGPGHMVNAYDLETPSQYYCLGDTSEVSYSRSVWDIADGPSTTDLTPGVDEDHDRLALSDSEVWQVYTGPIMLANNISTESFWDGWFDPSVANGYLPEMRDVFGLYRIEFWPDGNEPNNTTAQAPLITANGGTWELTYFFDPDGNGEGESDVDLFRLEASSGVTYTIETLNLLSDANTALEEPDGDGVTVLASNDDRALDDSSSLLVWTAPRSDVFYVRSTHAPDFGIYGSYDLQVTSP